MSIDLTTRSRQLGPPSLVSQWLQGSQINSIQRGRLSITAGSASNTASITAVATAYSIVNLIGWSSSGNTGGIEASIGRLTLTNATTVTANRLSDAAGLVTLSYEVIEFNPTVIRSVQSGFIAMAVATVTASATITAVVAAKSQAFCAGVEVTTDGNGGSDETFCEIQLTNATTVDATRQAAAANAVKVGYCVLEWF